MDEIESAMLNKHHMAVLKLAVADSRVTDIEAVLALIKPLTEKERASLRALCKSPQIAALFA